jgi:hypothetical protein
VLLPGVAPGLTIDTIVLVPSVLTARDNEKQLNFESAAAQSLMHSGMLLTTCYQALHLGFLSNLSTLCYLRSGRRSGPKCHESQCTLRCTGYFRYIISLVVPGDSPGVTVEKGVRSGAYIVNRFTEA